MKSSRATKLKDIMMPKKSGAENEADQDLSMLDDGGDMDGGAPGPVGQGDDEDLGADAPEGNEVPDAEGADSMDDSLEHVSDDDLLGELKRRGLMAASSPLGKAAEADLVHKSSPDEDATDEGDMDDEDLASALAKMKSKAPVKKKK